MLMEREEATHEEALRGWLRVQKLQGRRDSHVRATELKGSPASWTKWMYPRILMWFCKAGLAQGEKRDF